MKPFLLLAGVLSSVALSGCGGGLDPTPGNNGPTTVSARLTRSDFYDANTGRYYDIFVTDALYSGRARVAMHSNEFDTQFYVYEKDSSGAYSVIDDNDDANANTTDSDDSFTVTQGNTYRIVATSANGNEGGFYEIRFSSDLSTPAQVTTQDALLATNKAKFSLPARKKN